MVLINVTVYEHFFKFIETALLSLKNAKVLDSYTFTYSFSDEHSEKKAQDILDFLEYIKQMKQLLTYWETVVTEFFNNADSEDHDNLTVQIDEPDSVNIISQENSIVEEITTGDNEVEIQHRTDGHKVKTQHRANILSMSDENHQLISQRCVSKIGKMHSLKIESIASPVTLDTLALTKSLKQKLAKIQPATYSEWSKAVQRVVSKPEDEAPETINVHSPLWSTDITCKRRTCAIRSKVTKDKVDTVSGNAAVYKRQPFVSELSVLTGSGDPLKMSDVAAESETATSDGSLVLDTRGTSTRACSEQSNIAQQQPTGIDSCSVKVEFIDAAFQIVKDVSPPSTDIREEVSEDTLQQVWKERPSTIEEFKTEDVPSVDEEVEVSHDVYKFPTSQNEIVCIDIKNLTSDEIVPFPAECEIMVSQISGSVTINCKDTEDEKETLDSSDIGYHNSDDSSFSEHLQIKKSTEAEQGSGNQITDLQPEHIEETTDDDSQQKKPTKHGRWKVQPRWVLRGNQMLCRTCQQEFVDLKDLAEHWKTTPDCNKPLEEDEISCPLPVKQTGKKKRQANQTKDKLCLCEICGRTVSCIEALRIHLDVHRGKVNHQCTVCGKGFAGRSSLVAHMHVHMPPQFACTVCQKKFRRPDFLRRHMRIHADERPYSCPTCNQMFRSTSNLNFHMLTHKEFEPVYCEECGTAFKYKLSLQYHIQKMHGEKAGQSMPPKPRRKRQQVETFVCATCGAVMKGRQKLRQHHEMSPECGDGGLSVQCPDCPRRYSNKPALLRHRLRAHTQEPVIPCNICGKLFNSKEACKTHMLTHTTQEILEEVPPSDDYVFVVDSGDIVETMDIPECGIEICADVVQC